MLQIDKNYSVGLKIIEIMCFLYYYTLSFKSKLVVSASNIAFSASLSVPVEGTFMSFIFAIHSATWNRNITNSQVSENKYWISMHTECADAKIHGLLIMSPFDSMYTNKYTCIGSRPLPKNPLFSIVVRKQIDQAKVS